MTVALSNRIGHRRSPVLRPIFQGNGRIVFREYSFREENSLSLTEFWGKLGKLCEKLGEFAFGAQIIGREELTELSP